MMWFDLHATALQLNCIFFIRFLRPLGRRPLREYCIDTNQRWLLPLKKIMYEKNIEVDMLSSRSLVRVAVCRAVYPVANVRALEYPRLRITAVDVVSSLFLFRSAPEPSQLDAAFCFLLRCCCRHRRRWRRVCCRWHCRCHRDNNNNCLLYLRLCTWKSFTI